MWRRTFTSLLDEILQAEILANEAQANRFERLLAQLDNDLE
jgi:succinate dehydrogenase flavin-adding protein (antitoxin of CptAB toxin-antitoxin module)